jgi:hypothetical protein
MALTGTNVDYNTFVTDVYGTIITLSKPLVGTASGTGYFTPVSRCASRLPVPVGSAVEILKQPFVLNPNDNIRVASTGVGTGGLVASTTASGTIGSSRVTVASATNIEAGNLVSGTGIATNTYVGVGYTPASTSVPLTRALTSTIASSVISFTDIVIPQDGALATTIVYQSQPDSSGSIYQNAVGTLTTTFTNYYSAGTTYSAIIQSIRVTNISDSSIYPANDYPVWVGIGNSDTIFTYLAYNMVVPKNSSIELCEAPKRLGIGQSIFAYSQTPGVVEIQIAGRQSTV